MGEPLHVYEDPWLGGEAVGASQNHLSPPSISLPEYSEG